MRIAIGQMTVIPGDPATNLETASRFVVDAGEAGADVLVLPECLDLGWTDSSAAKLAEPVPGERSERLAAAAGAARVAVVAGLTERGANGAVYNTSVFLDSSGRLLATHRKINILAIAAHLYTPGSSLSVIDSDLGRIAIPVCADCLQETLEIPLALGRMGARLILSPSAWAVPPEFNNEVTPYGSEWVEPYREVAGRFRTTMVGVSSVGRIVDGAWAGYPCIGNSLVVGPEGIVHQAPFGADAEVLQTVEVEVYGG